MSHSPAAQARAVREELVEGLLCLVVALSPEATQEDLRDGMMGAESRISAAIVLLDQMIGRASR